MPGVPPRCPPRLRLPLGLDLDFVLVVPLPVRPGGSLDGGRCELLELRPSFSLSISTCLVNVWTCSVNFVTSCSSSSIRASRSAS